MKIKKGRHYGSPFPFPKFYLKKTKLEKVVRIKFDETIRYNIGSDQSDVNKLFGFSYGWHHNDSDRIGFRYNIERNQVEIVLYSYEKGNRIKTQTILFVNIGEPIEISLNVSINEIGRQVYAKVTQNTDSNCIFKYYSYKSCKWGYTLGLYFGGNQTAPHDILIEEEK